MTRNVDDVDAEVAELLKGSGTSFVIGEPRKLTLDDLRAAIQKLRDMPRWEPELPVTIQTKRLLEWCRANAYNPNVDDVA